MRIVYFPFLTAHTHKQQIQINMQHAEARTRNNNDYAVEFRV